MTRKTRSAGDYEDLAAWGNAPDVVAATANYAPVLGDAGSTIMITSGSGVTFTIAPESSIAWPVGSQFVVVQGGAGAITLTPGAGVTINKLAAKTLVTGGANATVTVRKTGTNTWVANGDLA
jgi:hypothetical protein